MDVVREVGMHEYGYSDEAEKRYKSDFICCHAALTAEGVFVHVSEQTDLLAGARHEAFCQR